MDCGCLVLFLLVEIIFRLIWGITNVYGQEGQNKVRFRLP